MLIFCLYEPDYKVRHANTSVFVNFCQIRNNVNMIVSVFEYDENLEANRDFF